MTRLLVIDDDVQLARALVSALSRAEYVAEYALTAAAGLEMVVTGDPQLVLLDLGLPDRDGVDVVKQIRSWSTVPVVILSGATDERRRVEALDAGADDFVQKPFGVDELLARVRAALRRAGPSDGEHAAAPLRTYGELSIDLQSRSVTVADEEVRLTPKEWRLLEVLCAFPGRLLTHRWILDEVWDSAHGEETRAALRAHIRSLRAKLGDKAGTPIYLRTESGVGYRWIAEEAGEDTIDQPDLPNAPDEDAGEERVRRPAEDLTHELNNALTALKVAVHLLRRRVVPAEGDAPQGVSELSIQVDQIVTRVSRLAVELELRVSQDSSGPS